MRSLNISQVDLDSVFATVAAILWIGEIDFEPKGEGSVVSPGCATAVENVAELLKVRKDHLMTCFTHRETQLSDKSKETFSRNHKVEEARYSRDSLAKTIYFRLFDWIVSKINSAIKPESPISSSIGVLDIYGFEIFKWNSFEQFCINYVNEKLQQIFIERTLKMEQEEYIRENIKWTNIEYFNNKIVCELIESKQNGILVLLNEACLVPRGTDETFHASMLDKLGSHPHFMKPGVKQSKTSFTIKHYAGDVEYESPGFLDKNKDLVWKDLLLIAESSGLSIFATMFPRGEAAEMGLKRPITASTNFREQVANLMEALGKCTPHYIRCIKPNDVKRAGVWDEERVLHQIRYLGLLENVKVRRAGFAFRQPFRDFLKRYKMICPNTWPHFDAKEADKGGAFIMAELKVDVGPQGYQLGTSKIFIKEPRTLFTLEKTRAKRVHELNCIISAHCKSKNYRLLLIEHRASRLLQSSWKAYEVRRSVERYKAARTLQAAWRKVPLVRYFKEHRASRMLQATIRRRNDMLWIQRYRAARSIQAIAKGVLTRKFTVKFRSAVMVQRTYRYYVARRYAIKIKQDISNEITPFKHRRRCSVEQYPARLYAHQFLENSVAIEIMHETGDNKVVFADQVLKYGVKFHPRERILVVTNLAVFDFEWFPDKKKEKSQVKLHHRFLLHSLASVSMSTLHDNVIVLHMPSQYDIAYSLERKCELAAVLWDQFMQVNKKALTLHVRLQIPLLMKDKKTRTLVFEETEEDESKNGAIQIRMDKKNSNHAIVSVKKMPLASTSKGEKPTPDKSFSVNAGSLRQSSPERSDITPLSSTVSALDGQ
eukprot:TRINITY_DN6265_c0_g3_i3.p1 TRINITY_DN6265_c0_g3~~TRINITY_DN6265_c0_g3_i3.p1  ORF type:complete len:851 (-),score=226.77 TRINITY_DN6265_c0_g3_i3:1893-4370(-)